MTQRYAGGAHLPEAELLSTGPAIGVNRERKEHMFSVTVRTEENCSKKRGSREREGTTDCGKWDRKMMQRAFQNIKMLRVRAAETALSEKAVTWEEGSTLVISLCHLVATLPVSIKHSTFPCSLSISCYLQLRLKVKITRIMFTAVYSFSDESHGPDFFGLFLAAMDLIAEF